jgi:hypothetical protein
MSIFEHCNGRIDNARLLRSSVSNILECGGASWSASEDELMEEYKGIRRAARQKKRNAG